MLIILWYPYLFPRNLRMSYPAGGSTSTSQKGAQQEVHHGARWSSSAPGEFTMDLT